jgi:hypothetical protein
VMNMFFIPLSSLWRREETYRHRTKCPCVCPRSRTQTHKGKTRTGHLSAKNSTPRCHFITPTWPPYHQESQGANPRHCCPPLSPLQYMLPKGRNPGLSCRNMPTQGNHWQFSSSAFHLNILPSPHMKYCARGLLPYKIKLQSRQQRRERSSNFRWMRDDVVRNCSSHVCAWLLTRRHNKIRQMRESVNE